MKNKIALQPQSNNYQSRSRDRATKNVKIHCGAMDLKNGAKETRTPDPLHAMQVLYQLSYGPIVSDQAIRLTR